MFDIDFDGIKKDKDKDTTAHIIPCCYDSHVHWLASGQINQSWLLPHLSSAEAIAQEKINPNYFRGDWLIGFGWDQNQWPGQTNPHRDILDKLFPTHPVALTRKDGHASWVNTQALLRAGLIETPLQKIRYQRFSGGRIEMDLEGLPTGLLLDQAKEWVDRFIPSPSDQQIREYLSSGSRKFNEAGFTHVRDMGGTESQWHQSLSLWDKKEISLAVDQNFVIENLNQFDSTLQLALKARKEQHPHVRVQGIKVFMDGALGSEGALLSRDYPSGSGKGLALLSEHHLRDILIRTWEVGLAVSVHVIGDESVHRVVKTAHQLMIEGFQGQLHLEHVEILRHETLVLMKDLSVQCHLQPCHWLSDKKWLKSKIGSLYSLAFPWGALEKVQVPFYFGSDSPIESPSVINNLHALADSRLNGISPLRGDPLKHHSHPSGFNWLPECYSEFCDKGRPIKVVFCGRELTND